MIWYHLSRPRTQINQYSHSHIIVAWYDHRLAFLLCLSLEKNCLKRGHGCTPQNIDLIEGLVWDLDWIFRQPTEKSSGLFWTRAEPVLNPYFTRANPNFWHKYIVFFQNTMFLKRVLNPCQTRTLPVQTRTICSGSEGSHLCHFCCNISTDSHDHMKIDIASESLVGDVGYLCYPLVKRELRSHQEFPNHMFVGGCGQECWNMLE